MKDKVEMILTKEMSRKEFLQHMGFAFLTVIGVSGLIKSLGESITTKSTSTSSLGYGSSPYGGAKKNF